MEFINSKTQDNTPNNNFKVKATANNKVNHLAFKYLVKAKKQIDAQKPTPKFDYLDEVKNFCQNLKNKGHLPFLLSVKQAMNIIIVADKLNVRRVDALKWGVSKKSVIINANFLSSLFASRDMLSNIRFYTNDKKEVTYILQITGNKEVVGQASYKDYLDNSSWKKDSKKAIAELALMKALKKAFPDVLIGIICEAEVPPSIFSQIKVLSIDFTNKLVEFGGCFITNLIAEIKSFTKQTKKSETKESSQESIQTTKTLSSENVESKEDMFLDYDDLEIKSPSNTGFLN